MTKRGNDQLTNFVEGDMNQRIRDFILALCVIGAIACFVAESFVTKQSLHHQLDKGGIALVISGIVVWLVL